MCDACSEILDLLPSYDLSTPWSNEKQLKKAEISIICTYVQSWLQRQCICCYKDPKNFDRFNHLIQGTLWVSIVVLEDIVQRDKVLTDPPDGQNKQEPSDEQPTPSVGPSNVGDGNADASCGNPPVAAKWVLSESWSAEETEKLLHFVSKIFLLNFPHYTAFKHSVHSKIEEISQQEMTALSMYCDINDTEIPIHLLRNVCYFCEVGGLQAMETSFAKSDPDVLPFPLVRSMVAVVANLKLWMGVRAIVKYLVPLRSNVIRYMCKLSDKDLRQAGSRALSEFMWTGVKDPLDTHLPFDKEGLELAFKYFVSSTLTMRLAGIAQINSHINMYTELCNSEAIADMENIGTGLSDWLTHNKIIENIFGPNLHVEIIKQSHIVLNFLAMEGRISKEHIDCIWSATQLKHCTKQVHDLLPPLIKHLEAGPALHLYHLLGRLEPHENTEQTLYLASALLKFIWSNSTHFPHVLPQSASSLDFGRVDTVFVSALGDEGDSVAHTLEGSFCQEQESQGCRHADVGDSGMKLTIEELCEGNLPPEIGLVLAGRRKPGSRSKLQRVSNRKRQAARTSSSSSGESDSDGDDCPERGNFSSGAAPSVNSSTSTTSTTSSSNSESEEDLVDVHVGRSEVVTRKRERCSLGPRPRWSRKKSRPQEQLEASVCEVGKVDVAVQGTPWIKCSDNPEQQQQKQQEQGEMQQDDQEKPKGYECMQYIGSGEGRRQRIRVDGGPIEDILSPDDGSCSSRMSTKSEKNMADFEGEESGCEDELIQLSGHPHLSGITSAYCAHLQRAGALPVQRCPQRFAERPNMQFDIASVCQPGQTLLWDLMQDDKVGDLGQGLALEAEKIFSSLVCWSSNRPIRMKFIEGCLENLARHRSVPMSLRLLPRLFSSFQPSRGHLDTHGVTMWAEKEHHMMDHFFSDLVVYTEGVRSGKNQSNSLYSHQVEIQVRLQFLNCVFSSLGSADSFRLTGEQISTLWFCLATDPEVSDELFSWLLSQVKDKDQHALGPETLQLLYTTNLPLLQPENMSMTALNLFQQLGGMLQHEQETLAVDNRGMDHLWGIALRAHNTDVSMAAIQYINSYYVNAHHRSLNCEEEFIERCMNSLKAAACELEKAEEASLLILQRGLLLLTVHLETFQRRYAYHLRTWHLAGNGIYSHQRPLLEKQASLLRVVCQPAGLSEKVTLEMLGSDYVAELRAEVTQWWERFQRQQKEQQKEEPVDSNQQANFSRASTSFAVVEDGKQPQSKTPPATSSTSSLTPILGAMLTEGPIRVITQGQELTADFDERTLQELGFKDMQLVFVSVGAVRLQRRREGPGPPSCLPPPPRERVPMLLLLRPHYLEQLFQLMQQLSALCTTASALGHNSHTKGRLLSWRVWELLMMLPTCPVTLEAFQTLGDETFERLLNPTTPHRLMYCLQVVEFLALSRRGRCHQTANESNLGVRISSQSDLEDGEDDWAQRFVDKGGLRHLFGIFTSGSLRKKPDTLWDEWSQDCLSCVLKLIYQLGIDPLDAELVPAAPSESGPSTTPRHRMKRQKSCSEKLEVPRLNDAMLAMMSSVENVVESIASILLDAGLTRPWAGSIMTPYQMGGWGRGQLIHYTLVLLLSWAFSCNRVKDVLFGNPSLVGWIKVLLLEDPEPCIRREVCSSLYRLCLGSSPDRRSGQHFVAPLLQRLLEFLSEAQNMKPFRIDFSETDEKEPYGPACRDYYWLVCRLVGSLQDFEEDSSEVPKLSCQLDLDSMARQLASAILDRDFLEGRHNTVEDDGLVGLICLCTAVIKHNPPFKFSQEGQEFLRQMFNCLFALPSPKQRHLPKCKSQSSRAAAYDLLVDLTRDSLPNYKILHASLLQQHTQDMSRCSFDADCHTPYPWDYWPHEDGRSDCGYVGLTNLGATCYMASCMQHLYMMPQARASILSAKCNIENKHESMLVELQRMFAYLLESERKAYNPRSFCKVYTMDHQPLNTGEQKDMAEFFTDLISKLEETTPQLRELVKTLFCGVITNNVVSLDCPHVSCTLEEFYTVRCQVADMRNLYESLDEVTVKDTLEGDNMYTCSQCGKKVRAEKRACFKKLPRILCFNTMRYTFNMVTMTKEKVNTHFSFPLRLDMAKYTERNLMPGQHLGADSSTHQQENFEYDLIGVTVHTGTADGGHYYSFIRDRTANNRDKWFLFNDAEVKPFDPSQIAAECFGGEMISKTYDSVTDKFMDFSFEKTNSAYMLFYERTNCPRSCPSSSASTSTATETRTTQEQLPKDLADWIWEDNMLFLQDKNIFEHNYFGFMWQVCSLVPQTLSQHQDVTLMAAKLSTSFVLETLIHAKEKPTMVQWIELLTKQFNSSQNACEWFLDHMVEHDWWPVQILICCPNQVVRQMFQRLCIHVINKLRPLHFRKFLLPIGTDNNDGSIQVGSQSCITRFIRRLLFLMEHNAGQHTKHLTEYFGFLLEFAKMGVEECRFMLAAGAISTMVSFYLGQRASDYQVEAVSDEEEEDDDEEVLTISEDKYRPAALEKMITLVALLVEKSRGEDQKLHLSNGDFNAVAGGKGFPFLRQQIRDNANLRQVCNLVFSLCRWNDAHDSLAVHIVKMILQSITQHPEQSQPFFKLLSMLVEFAGGPPGLPTFSALVISHIWEVAENCPQQCLEWLALQVPRNKVAHSWVIQGIDAWVEHFLLAHNNQRVRNAAACLLVSLVPSNHFKQAFRSARSVLGPQKEIPMSPDAQLVLHQIYELLLRLLKRARLYADPAVHGNAKLMSYFALLTYCLVSRTEKLMFGQHFLDLWQLFQPKLSEPSIAIHHNKQALLIFWYQVCVDCPENVKLIVQNAHVTKNIAFNYILADHDDQEVVIFNRYMLPAYYGLLRLCCQQSRAFTRQLASHQNIQWAFKNITPYPTQYPVAVEELFKLMRLFATRYTDSSEQELREVTAFRRSTLQLYLTALEGRSCWVTLNAVLGILLEINEDRLFFICNDGLALIFESYFSLHVMYHEATACHVIADLVKLLAIAVEVLKCARMFDENKEVHQHAQAWKERSEAARKLLSMLNAYTPLNLQQVCIETLRELLLLYPAEMLQILVPSMLHVHMACYDNPPSGPPGPYFPRRDQKPSSLKSSIHARHPGLQMCLHPSMLEAPKGTDTEYHRCLAEYFLQYHLLVDIICRVAVNQDMVTDHLVNLSALVGLEGAHLHFAHFPKLWLDIHQVEQVDKKCIDLLCACRYFADYVLLVLTDLRETLIVPVIKRFIKLYISKVTSQVINEQTLALVGSLLSSLQAALELDISDILQSIPRLHVDLHALSLLLSVDTSNPHRSQAIECLQKLSDKCKAFTEAEQQETEGGTSPIKRRKLSTPERFQPEEMPAESSLSPLSVATCSPQPITSLLQAVHVALNLLNLMETNASAAMPSCSSAPSS